MLDYHDGQKVKTTVELRRAGLAVPAGTVGEVLFVQHDGYLVQFGKITINQVKHYQLVAIGDGSEG